MNGSSEVVAAQCGVVVTARLGGPLGVAVAVSLAGLCAKATLCGVRMLVQPRKRMPVRMDGWRPPVVEAR
jgi:hypothetical protein